MWNLFFIWCEVEIYSQVFHGIVPAFSSKTSRLSLSGPSLSLPTHFLWFFQWSEGLSHCLHHLFLSTSLLLLLLISIDFFPHFVPLPASLLSPASYIWAYITFRDTGQGFSFTTQRYLKKNLDLWFLNSSFISGYSGALHLYSFLSFCLVVKDWSPGSGDFIIITSKTWRTELTHPTPPLCWLVGPKCTGRGKHTFHCGAPRVLLTKGWQVRQSMASSDTVRCSKGMGCWGLCRAGRNYIPGRVDCDNVASSWSGHYLASWPICHLESRELTRT